MGVVAVPDLQLYLAIVVPIVVNSTVLVALLLLVSGALNIRLDDLRADLNRRLDDLRTHFDQRFTDLEKIWDEKLARVEGVIDARLKHLEER